MPTSPVFSSAGQQHRVRLVGVLLRAEPVGLVVKDRIDLFGRDEVLEVDRLAALARGCLDLVLGQDDVAARARSRSRGRPRRRDLLVLLGAHALVLQRRAVRDVQLAEADLLRRCRAVDLDRDIDEPEPDCAVP
jgi:hypothetical protein